MPFEAAAPAAPVLAVPIADAAAAPVIGARKQAAALTIQEQ
jgi:hypothetical protein